MSEEFCENHFDTQVIGCGPAGLGLVVAADRLGKLDEWLRCGVLFVDKANSEHLGSGNFHGLNIRSNSPASDYLETIGKDGVFAEVLNAGIGLEIKRHRDQILSLLLVAEFLETLRERFQRVLNDYPQSKLITDTTILRANCLPDGHHNRFVTIAQDGRSFTSRNLILATGGRSKQYSFERRKTALGKAAVFDSDSILHGQHTQEIVEALQAAPFEFIVIIGNSHSAWSAARELEETILPQCSNAIIAVLARNSIKVFYESRESANNESYSYDDGDICKETGRVNRFGGIRGDAKALHHKIIESDNIFTEGDLVEPFQNIALQLADTRRCRVALVHCSARNENEVQELLNVTPVVISAIGYEANVVPIYQNDVPIGPRLKANGQIDVDKNCRVFDTQGGLINGAYALGLAHGVTPDGTLGGEPNFNGTLDGVNLYQGVIGERLLQQIL